LKENEKESKSTYWPKKNKLVEALKVIEDFRLLCQFQMELGYWATTDFPTKHHLNKILSTQYMDKKLLEKVYGKGLAKRVNKLLPYCKHYASFTRLDSEQKNAK